MSNDDEPMRDRTTIHISIHEAATSDEAEAFFDDLGEWVGAWMEARPAIQWEPFVWSHTESCDDSDHCHGPGSWVERRIAARTLREAADVIRDGDERCKVQRTCHYSDALTLDARAVALEAKR